MSRSIKLKDNTYIDISGIYRNILMIKFNNLQYIANTNVTKLIFDTKLFENGDQLSISNGGIKIGKNISKIMVNLQLWTQNQDGYTAFYIYKNDSEMTFNIIPVKSVESWHFASVSTYLDVEENDIIYGAVRFSVANNGNSCNGMYNNSCRLSVEQIV